MSEAKAYSYAVVRVVPRVERDEFVNVGVILFSAELRFLAAGMHLDERRILGLWAEADLAAIHRHTVAIQRICSGDRTAGPIALLPPRERFGWLTAPRSTVIQVSPVRIGLTRDPEATLSHLLASLVI